MARRKKVQEEHVNHERWLVSYADFITLLFAFFVVMYAISSVNEGKYRVLSETLNMAFEDPRKTLDPIQVGEIARGNSIGPDISTADVEESQPDVGFGLLPEPVAEVETSQPSVDPAEEKRLGYIAGNLESVLSPLIDDELVDIQHNQFWIDVNMKSKMLFDSGSARLSRFAMKALRDVAKILKPLPNTIHVEGYTDNVPIETLSFPSNWELSAARAASVVHLFTRLGVDPKRMAAIGYGEHQPIADNNTEIGRLKNRRVSLIILAAGQTQGTKSAHAPAGRASFLSQPGATQ